MAVFKRLSQTVLRSSFNQSRQLSAVAHGEQHQSGAYCVLRPRVKFNPLAKILVARCGSVICSSVTLLADV